MRCCANAMVAQHSSRHQSEGSARGRPSARGAPVPAGRAFGELRRRILVADTLGRCAEKSDVGRQGSHCMPASVSAAEPAAPYPEALRPLVCSARQDISGRRRRSAPPSVRTAKLLSPGHPTERCCRFPCALDGSFSSHHLRILCNPTKLPLHTTGMSVTVEIV